MKKKKLQDFYKLTLFAESPEPATYTMTSGFTKDMEFRTVLPKTNYYSFGKSSPREAFDAVYVPGRNSPRLKESRGMPGPGEYSYSNFSIGKEGRKFQFYERTTNVHGTCNNNFSSIMSFSCISLLKIFQCSFIEPENIAVKQNVPGPGTYAALGINKLGIYPVSTFQ